jgi:CheY-like chemotaxis protein
VIVGDEGARPPAHRTPVGDAIDARTLTPYVLLDVVRRLRARERGYLAGLLHDGPIQDLAVLALELGLPRGDGSDDLIRRVDTAGRALSQLQDELWPFPRPGSGLVETVERRTAWLLTTSLAVAVGQGAEGLPEGDVQVVAEVVELILVGLGHDGSWDRPAVMVRAEDDLILLELTMTSAPGCDVGGGGGGVAAVAWLRRVAAAIQAATDVRLDDRRLRALTEIPRCPPAGPAKAREGAVPAPRGGEQTILVVDDEPALLSAAAQILRQNGYATLEAANYDQALELAASREFQLLLTDSVMPHMSGATLAQRITQLRPGLPVLYMSGYGPAAADASPGADQAAGMHLQKPFTAQALLQAVSQALNPA